MALTSKFTLASMLCAGLLACEQQETETSEFGEDLAADTRVELRHSSVQLTSKFPLLPLVEKENWSRLLEWEKALKNNNHGSDKKATFIKDINQLGDQLEEAYPFYSDSEVVRLGAVRYFKSDGRLEIPAEVSYPKSNQEGSQHEVEVVLCTEKGRVHETLFLTEARPLHLELLLHLTGSKKSQSAYSISIALPGEPLLPLSRLLETTTNIPLPEPFTFCFSGSAYGQSYGPDATGDVIITWHVHDAVMQATDEAIGQARTRLRVIEHPSLEEGMKVRLVLTPRDGH